MPRQLSPYFKLSLLFALAATFVGKCSAEIPSRYTAVAVTDSIPTSNWGEGLRPDITGLGREGEMLKHTLPPPQPKPPKEEMLFGPREIMPLFPGSDATKPYAERKHQADSLMLSFVYENLRYPQTAWNDSVQGMAVVSFIVEKDGSVTGAKVVRNPGGGTGEEALRVINLMAERNLRWVPGTQMEKPVRVQFNLPVKFRITEKTKLYPANDPPQERQRTTNRNAPTMPLFPGCAEVGNFYAARECSDSLLRAFIYGNLRYPYRAYRDSLEGIAVVNFTVGEDGRVSSAKLLRSPGKGTGEEALRLVQLMARKDIRWVPGTRDGKPVKVEYNLPIRFKLTEKTLPAPPLPPPPPLNNGCEELFKVVDEMPRFPGCEELVDEAERKACSYRLLLQYLYANLKLTPLQAQSCASGMVVIQFVIEKDGMVTDAKIVRDIGVGYGQTALKAVESMNANGIRWTPGRQGGHVVRVQYNVPIRICLE